jgi:hypothetical protein
MAEIISEKGLSMTNWKDDLNKKEKELNLKKEVTNDVPTQTTTGVNNRNSDRGSRDVNLSNLRKKELSKNFRKGGRIMIPSKGLFSDYDAIDKEKIGAAEKVWKYIPKLIKTILNCRTNTVKIMDKFGIPREEIKKKEEVK